MIEGNKVVIFAIVFIVISIVILEFFSKPFFTKPAQVLPVFQTDEKTDTTKGSINILSEMPNISIQEREGYKITELLAETSFFTPQAIALWNNDGLQTKTVTARNINIRITDKEQPLGQHIYTQSGKDIVFQSYGMNYDEQNQIVDLFLYVEPLFVKESDTTQLEEKYSDIFLFALWDLTHPLTENYSFEEEQKLKSKFLESKAGLNLFSISK